MSNKNIIIFSILVILVGIILLIIDNILYLMLYGLIVVIIVEISIYKARLTRDAKSLAKIFSNNEQENLNNEIIEGITQNELPTKKDKSLIYILSYFASLIIGVLVHHFTIGIIISLVIIIMAKENNQNNREIKTLYVLTIVLFSIIFIFKLLLAFFLNGLGILTSVD